MLKEIKGIGIFDTDSVRLGNSSIEINMPVKEMNSEIQTQINQWKEWYKKNYANEEVIYYSDLRILYNCNDLMDSNFAIRFYAWQEINENLTELEMFEKDIAVNSESATFIRKIVLEACKNTFICGDMQ